MVSSRKEPKLIPGALSVDDRGQLSFANDFSFEGIRRFYLVENFSTEVVRAFHGHLHEEKYVLVVSGAAIVAVVSMDDPTRPSKANPVQRFVLSAAKPALLHVPAGYANGFRPLEPSTKIMFFSTATLEESKSDDHRFPFDYWGKEVWVVENR